MSQLDAKTEQDISKAVLMEALVSQDAGIQFLQWLCELCRWNRPVFDRDADFGRVLWMIVRQHIPMEKLPSIEYHRLREQQGNVQAMLKAIQLEIHEQELVAQELE